jgi:glutamine synthetase
MSDALTLHREANARAADDLVARVTLGEDLTELYTKFKRDEWARFCGAVTDWEDMMYRQWIP